ncbi:unnamed protein product [Paramecium pentaurelia]|uniref:Uncharacterized protein n=1 Tax=Paramecium pentaurelia TaxID=43138 RepID=A0A8S1YKX2_9CILI|nr:unnamed protein product [Paramecium pentaurelia]
MELLINIKQTQQFDLIISGSEDRTIKFWIKKNEWLCQLTIDDCSNRVLGLSLNQQKNRVVSCGNDQPILIIENQVRLQSGKQYKRFKLNNNNMFKFSQRVKEQISVFGMNPNNEQFTKTRDITIKCVQDNFSRFSYQYINSKCILVSKNGEYVNLVRKQQNGGFQTEQSIHFGINSLSILILNKELKCLEHNKQAKVHAYKINAEKICSRADRHLKTLNKQFEKRNTLFQQYLFQLLQARKISQQLDQRGLNQINSNLKIIVFNSNKFYGEQITRFRIDQQFIQFEENLKKIQYSQKDSLQEVIQTFSSEIYYSSRLLNQNWRQENHKLQVALIDLNEQAVVPNRLACIDFVAKYPIKDTKFQQLKQFQLDYVDKTLKYEEQQQINLHEKASKAIHANLVQQLFSTMLLRNALRYRAKQKLINLKTKNWYQLEQLEIIEISNLISKTKKQDILNGSIRNEFKDYKLNQKNFLDSFKTFQENLIAAFQQIYEEIQIYLNTVETDQYPNNSPDTESENLQQQQNQKAMKQTFKYEIINSVKDYRIENRCIRFQLRIILFLQLVILIQIKLNI